MTIDANLNLNTFQQQTILGATDLQVTKAGVLSVQIDASQATALTAGSFVKLYSSNTGPMPTVVAAGVDDVALGAIAYNVKQATFSALDVCEVALNDVVMWLAGAGTITPGTIVYDNGSGEMTTSSSGAHQRGIALDYCATAGNLFRVLLTNPII